MNINKTSLLLLSVLIHCLLCDNTVKFHYSGIDAPVMDVIWCGTNKNVILILTAKFSVFQSTDKGFTWKNINDEFMSKARDLPFHKEQTDNFVRSMIHSPIDSSLIYFIGSNDVTWITENCGTTIKANYNARSISNYVYHPTERNWALGSFIIKSCEDKDETNCKIVKQLYYTQNLGTKWELIGDYILQFAWGAKDMAHIKLGVPKERIIMTYNPRGKGTQDFENRWNYKIDLVYSDDFFRTKIVGVRKGNRFIITDKYIYVSQVIDQETQEAQLLIAKSTDKKYQFNPIVTNQKRYKEHSFSFLDTTEDTVFLYINNFGESSTYGNIYTSDADGKEFSLSLKNNLQLEENLNDFENVRSVEGLYIANAISGKYMKLAQKELEAAQTSNVIDNSKKNLNYKNYVKTLITHNRGGDWKRLKAPSADSNGKEYNCGNYCFLNLYSYSSSIPQFYAVDSAAGLIIGNGNVGHYLDYSNQDIGLFISRDGGVNWAEIRKGTYIYEIGDHGGIIVVSLFDQPTRSILYTLNEGLTWVELNISDELMTIKNILSEPKSSQPHFLVYGSKKKDGEMTGMVIELDFTSLGLSICGKSDFEIWSPTSGKIERECLLGKKISYSRKKRTSQCLMGEQFQRKVIVDYCTCTEDDYQCDMNFVREEEGKPCTLIPGLKNLEQINAPPANCQGYYFITKGYRKIPGNKCVKGSLLDPIKVSCPYNPFWKTFVYLFYLVITVALIYFLYYLYSNCDSFNDCIIIIWKSFQDKFKKMPEYLNIDDNDEDNTIFATDEPKIESVSSSKDKDDEKKETKKTEANKSDNNEEDNEKDSNKLIN